MADEVCLQMHLLNLSFGFAVDKRATSPEQATEIRTKQLTGIAGIAAERIQRALGLPADEAGALRTLELHPLLNPVAYTGGAVEDGTITRDAVATRPPTAAGSPCSGPAAPARCRPPCAPSTRTSTSRSPAPTRTGR